MKQLVPGIRNTVRAVIVRDDRLLLVHNRGDDGEDRFALPGGAQDLGETLAQTLQRECLEEIRSAVAIGPLLHVADYFKPRRSEPRSTSRCVTWSSTTHPTSAPWPESAGISMEPDCQSGG